MKFVCQQCHTKYSIEDARVKGKVLKIRCKTCQGLITVRDPALGEADAAHHEDAHVHAEPHDAGDHTQVGSAPGAMLQALARPAPVPSRVLWYVSFDGEQEGPHPVDKARDRIRDEVAGGKEAFCWRDGFADWLPVDKVPDLAAAIRPASAAKPGAPVAARPAPSVAAGPATSVAPAAATTPAKPIATSPAAPAKPAAATVASPAKPAAAILTTPATLAAAPVVTPAKPATAPAAAAKVAPAPAAKSETANATPTVPAAATAIVPARTTAAAPAATATPAPVAVESPPHTVAIAAKPVAAATPIVPHPTPLVAKSTPTPAAVSAVKPTAASSVRLVSAPGAEPAALGPFDSSTTGSRATAKALEAKVPDKTVESKAKPVAPVKAEARPASAVIEGKVEIAPEVEVKPKAARPAVEPKPSPPVEPKAIPRAAKPGEKNPEKPANKVSKESASGGALAMVDAAAQAEPLPLPAAPVRKNGLAHTNGTAHAAPLVAVLPPPADPTMIVVNPPREQKGMLVYALLGCVALILLLGSALGYTMLHKGHDAERSVTEATFAAKEAAPTGAVAPTVDDRPVGMAEAAPMKPVTPTPVAATAIIPPTAGHHPARGAHHPGGTPATPPALSSQQKALASLYGGSQDHADVGKVPVALHNDRPREQVSDSQIAGVVTRNKKSLQLCYERVLKHDNSLRNLRTDVTLKIGISGRVTGVSFSDGGIASGDLGKCLSQTIRRWAFPPQDAEYQTAFPIILQAQ